MEDGRMFEIGMFVLTSITGINTSFIIFLFVDYLKFRNELDEKINKKYVTRVECQTAHNYTGTTLSKMEKDLERIEDKIDSFLMQLTQQKGGVNNGSR